RCVPLLSGGERPLVYLDHAASTHPPAAVLESYVDFLEHAYANVHRGTYQLSREASQRFDQAYQIVADFIGGELSQGCVTFSANTTQAIDLCSFALKDRAGIVLTTELEHHSNDLPHRRFSEVVRARALPDGALDLSHLEELLKKNRVKLVALTAGSNVSGV